MQQRCEVPVHDHEVPVSGCVLELRTIGKDRQLVVCDSGLSFVLYDRELLQYGIGEGVQISEALYARICDDILRVRAWNRCLYLLEKQDYTQAQIRRKLAEGYYPPEIIEETIRRLCGMHAIDDRRYAQTYLRTNRTKYSRYVLEQKLMQRGIPKELTEEVMSQGQEYAPDEEAQIAAILKKKHFNPQKAAYEERNRIRQMLQRKGFCSEMILRMTQE